MPSRLWPLLASIFSIPVNPAAAWPQSATPPISVHGVAFDSLRGAPLAGAFIMIAGSGRNAITDERGRFVFDSMPQGEHIFFIQHPALDSVGLSELSARVTVRDGRDTARVNIPSFDALWAAACGAKVPPSDGALVFGIVRTTTKGGPVADASVHVSWIQTKLDEKGAITQQRLGVTVRSGPSGAYALCGVPGSVALRLVATADSAATGVLELLPQAAHVQHRDLLLGPTRGWDADRGTVVGVVRDDGSRVLAGARVVVDSVPEARTGTNGRFVLRNVPAGTRQIEVLSIGSTPVTALVNVFPGDTAAVDLQLPHATTLDTMRVTAAMSARDHFVSDIEFRKKTTVGRFVDSTQVGRHADMMSAISELPRYRCLSVLWVDKLKIADRRDIATELRLLEPGEVGMLEWYERRPPPEFGTASGGCVLVVWTKRALPH